MKPATTATKTTSTRVSMTAAQPAAATVTDARIYRLARTAMRIVTTAIKCRRMVA